MIKQIVNVAPFPGIPSDETERVPPWRSMIDLETNERRWEASEWRVRGDEGEGEAYSTSQVQPHWHSMSEGHGIAPLL
jgi:hypothetical protein